MNKHISNNIALSSIFLALVAVFVLLTITIFGGNADYVVAPNLPDQSTETGVTDVLDNFNIEIEKIGVIAPVIKNVNGDDKEIYNQALKDGVAHYRGTALPKDGSNVFIFGHSSSLIGQNGDYGDIFKDLADLEIGDTIVITYEGEKIEYKVSGERIVEETEISVLSPTEEEQITLMTCWPIGTSEKRLIVTATL